MKKIFIVANWKSNKTESEAKEWLTRFKINDPSSDKEIIICPSFTLLPILKSYILNHKSSIKLGTQDISLFEEGSYTGEVNGKQIKEFADYVIIGHSERRKNLNESDKMLEKKVLMAKKYKLNPIFCIQSEKTKIPKDVEIVSYEPIFAIGTGYPDTPESAENISKSVKDNSGIATVLYGGSVTSENVSSFTKMQNVSGVLVGKASLDPVEFMHILLYA